MFMKKNQIILLIVILAILMGFGYFYKQSLRIKQLFDPFPSMISVSQIIEIELSISKQFEVISGSTALDLLKQTTTIETKGESVNAYVVTINGRTASNTDKEYWAFYVNGKPASVGAGSYKLMPNDRILWKIEKFQ